MATGKQNKMKIGNGSAGNQRGGKYNILLIGEGNSAINQATVSTFSEPGNEIAICPDHLLALSKLDEFAPDLVFLREGLPSDSFEVCRQIHRGQQDQRQRRFHGVGERYEQRYSHRWRQPGHRTDQDSHADTNRDGEQWHQAQHERKSIIQVVQQVHKRSAATADCRSTLKERLEEAP